MAMKNDESAEMFLQTYVAWCIYVISYVGQWHEIYWQIQWNCTSCLTLRGSVVWTERSHLNLRSRAETVIWKIIVIISSAVRKTCSETRLTLSEGATEPHASVSWVGLAIEDFSVQFLLFLSHTVEYKHSDKNLWHWHIFLFENCHVRKH